MSVQRRRHGQEALIYRTVATTDRRGTPLVAVDWDNPHAVKAVFIPQRSSRASVPGQQQIDVYRMIVTHELPGVDAYSRVVWQGIEWDVITPPSYHHGTRHTRHWTLDIRRRTATGG